MTLLSWSLLFLGIVLPNSKSLSTALRYGHGEQLRFLVEDSQTARVPRRFLHITDMHIDPHYDVSADPSYLCHSREKSFGGLNVEDAGVDVLNLTMGLRDPIASAWNKDFSGSGKRVAGSGPGVMGYYGAPVTGCDSPIALINITFDFLQSYITTTKLDFVVWTGDNARHDSDSSIPRTAEEVFLLNGFAMEYFKTTFNSSVPVIPSIGNNDVPLHNTLPYFPHSSNEILDFYYRLWSDYIPSWQASTFRRLGCFVQTVDETLWVVSLNTMFLYNANLEVGECSAETGKGVAGREVLKWLEEVLRQAKESGVNVIVSGHVPPTPMTYYTSCYHGYTKLASKYRTTLLASMFGHVNIDHWWFAMDGVTSDSVTASLSPMSPYGVTQSSLEAYAEVLMQHYEAIWAHTKRGRSEAYGLVFVSPSVVPTFHPGLRIWNWVNDQDGTSGKDSGNGKGKGSARLTGYEQYYLNLTDWNSKHFGRSTGPKGEKPKWELLYTPLKSYFLTASEPLVSGFAKASQLITGMLCDQSSKGVDGDDEKEKEKEKEGKQDEENVEEKGEEEERDVGGWKRVRRRVCETVKRNWVKWLSVGTGSGL